MRKKKSIIFISALLIVIFSAVACKFNLKYLYGSVIYGDKSPVKSKIIFSKETGFYENEFYLKVYAPTNEIYYTLDGSEPGKNSLKYEKPILIDDASCHENTNSMREDFSAGFLVEDDIYQTPEYLIDKCTILKVTYYDETGEKGEVEERVYFVNFDSKTGYDNVNIISITSNSDDLFGEEEGIYVLGETFQKYSEVGIDEEEDWIFWPANYRNGGMLWEREANINVFNENKEPVLSQKVGIRIQGGASRGLYPKSFNIYARDEYGDDRLRYDFWGTGYYAKRMTLSCGGNDYRGKLLDRVGSELTRECAFSTMNYEPYVLFLNGEYWGFYYLTEKYDEHYIEQYYGVNHENVVIVKKTSLEVGNEEDILLYDEMCEFIENSDMTTEENYLQACELLDMDSFIDYFAAEIYMARQIDWPNSNYALWRVREEGTGEYEDGKWRWLLFDLNTAAMQKKSVDHDTIESARQRNGLFQSLWKNADFRERFTKRILEMSETIFKEDVAIEKVDECVNLMYEPMQKHHQRFFGKAFEDEYPTEDSIKTFMKKRAKYIPQILETNTLD